MKNTIKNKLQKVMNIVKWLFTPVPEEYADIVYMNRTMVY